MTRSTSSREKSRKCLDELSDSLNHTIVEGIYENIYSVFKIKCNKHNQIFFETTVYNYKRRKKGLPCCGFAAKKQKARNYKRNKQGKYIKDNIDQS